MGAGPNDTIRLSIAQRGVLANPGGAQALVRRDNDSSPTDSSQPSGTIDNSPVATKLLLSPTFTAIAAQAELDQTNSRLAVPVSQLDGEYIITVSKLSNSTNGRPAGSAPAPAASQVSAPSASLAAVQPNAAAPAAPSAPFGISPPAASPVAPAPVAAAVYWARNKRQLAPSTPSASPAAPQPNGIDITTQWIQDMVLLQTGGDSLNVNAIINQYMAETMNAAADTLGF
jgi:hypothetical protein